MSKAEETIISLLVKKLEEYAVIIAKYEHKYGKLDD